MNTRATHPGTPADPALTTSGLPSGPGDAPAAQESQELAYSLRGVGVTLPTTDGPLTVLDGVDLAVGHGQVVSIVGRSGTGKTTLLRLLGGLLRPTVGEVEISGRTVTAPPEEVVTVFQDYAAALLPWRSVARNVALPLERRLPRAKRNERVTEALTMVGLEKRARDFPWRLSGGMQQRVQIARALSLQPRILLMDEPFGALDAMTKSELQDQLLRLQRKTGATIILITHDLEEAIYLGDSVCLIAGAPGHIALQIETGLPRERDQISTREDPRYLEVRHQLHAALRAEDHG